MRVERKYDLSSQNTFRMRVSCECYIEYESVAELESLDFDSLPKPVIHIGEGSNLLFTSEFFPGTVLHSAIRYIKYMDMGMEDVPVLVGSGVCFDNLVEETCRHGLWGLENLSLIPGEVGAAAVQNIGAYGVEVKDVISGITCYDVQERTRVKFSVPECGYAYRSSVFKQPENRGRYIVTGVLFRLSRKPQPKLSYKGVTEALGGRIPEDPMKVRDAVIGIRRTKLPDTAELGSAGSFFKNPVVGAEEFSRISPDGAVPHYIQEDGGVKIPAAWLIENCGFKGAFEGGAAVYEKQPLVIVNKSGNASAADVIALERRIINGVRDRFGVDLSPEVEHI